MESKVMQNFKNPSSEYRALPFWAWNAKMEPEELKRQIHIMKEMGQGGFFMHSRVGMNVPYLSEEWFRCINACVEEAEKLGMKAWLYDEDRWPSGAAGSLVTRDPKYRKRHLVCQEYSSASEFPEGTVFFALHFSGDKIVRYERTANPASFENSPAVKVYAFTMKLNKTMTWFNNGTYLDTLNPEATAKFIEVTHDAYARNCGSQFNKTIPGIFSDEPNYKQCDPDGTVPWTGILPQRFMEKYGYDLQDHLPELFFHCGKTVSKVRWNYYDLVTDMFMKGFIGQISQWCEKHNIAMTGHLLWEDDLRMQTLCVGSAMRAYETMQQPGIDLLTEYTQCFNTAIQCASVARQCGHDLRLTETYGCTGWDFPFMGHKALGDWQYALGINVRCQHLAWYSMEAEAKRDYPASISFQSTWYKQYHLVEDYFARLGTIMTGGKEIRDILVIHPIESYWSMQYGEADALRNTLDQNFTWLTARLLTLNISFDFGEEEMLGRLAKVGKDVFMVGKAEYKAILIPEIQTIRSSTLKLLTAWAEQGGMVAYLGEPPEFVDAEPSDEAKNAYRKFHKETLNYLGSVLLEGKRRISITDSSGEEIGPVLSHLAEKDHVCSLFVCNTGTEFGCILDGMKMVRERNLAFPEAEIKLRLPENGDVYELNPDNGDVCRIRYSYSDGLYSFRTSFAPLQSRLFLITHEKLTNAVQRTRFLTGKEEIILPENGLRYELSDNNVLVLDHFRLTIDGKAEPEKLFFIQADDLLRKHLGEQPRGGAMVQPWMREHSANPKTAGIELLYELECQAVPEEDCLLAIERPELYDLILLNGKEISLSPAGYWVDPVLKTLHVPHSLLRSGKNELKITGKYNAELPGLESVFLLGKFGVCNERISCLPETLHIGDWDKQGFMEYAGDITYHWKLELAALEKGEHLLLKLGAWRGSLLSVSVNNGPEQMLPWQPFEADITDWVKTGANDLKIRVYGSGRNAFGPFFTGKQWMPWNGPGEFKEYVSDLRQLVPSGLLSTPRLVFCTVK